MSLLDTKHMHVCGILSAALGVIKSTFSHPVRQVDCQNTNYDHINKHI